MVWEHKRRKNGIAEDVGTPENSKEWGVKEAGKHVACTGDREKLRACGKGWVGLDALSWLGSVPLM